MKNNKKLEKSEDNKLFIFKIKRITQAHLRMRIEYLQKNRELIIKPLLA